ncbi:2-phospho-L-lactate guanylyltransferase [Methylobacterium sp. NEAU 140]|uniref:2-phospho-L-lactate guanylyltransferase n=1 Tax=Methylobacterium sp. NEAU 140 TaxID=3064945 RepID=UPI0027351185|nr:2-phospho-L-lactate guanylyltransferase [Methylobacterium sp. NEAU 140]MDP4021995.1 2-phospho-L-lactate guanylyltransferase [Methylobacterium sp. NEAU 140]
MVDANARRQRAGRRILFAMPMKDVRLAKTRLAPILDDDRRERVAYHMFEDSQRFFADRFPSVDRLVVTPSERIAGAARALGAWALVEPTTAGLNAAARRARLWATERRYDGIVIIPCDIAFWVAEEIEELVESGNENDVVVAPSIDGGTNALSLRLPSTLPFRYGPQSADRHLAEARARGLTTAQCHLAFLSHDLDTPEDLAAFGRTNAGMPEADHDRHCGAQH